jgi:hypothetical protein
MNDYHRRFRLALQAGLAALKFCYDVAVLSAESSGLYVP